MSWYDDLLGIRRGPALMQDVLAPASPPVRIYSPNPDAPQYAGVTPAPQPEAPWWSRVGNAVADAPGNLWRSLPPNVRDTYTSGFNALVDMSTPASIRDYTTSAQDTAKSAMRGDGWGTATNALATVNAALGAVPLAGLGVTLARKGAQEVGQAIGKEGQNFIRAYHGSPHSFDKFDLSKIGTGEGAQAYGHGLYFAENEGVAKGYRDNLAGKNNPLTYQAYKNGKEVPWSELTPDQTKLLPILQEAGGDLEKAKQVVRTQYFDSAHDRLIRGLDDLVANGYEARAPGSMYEVAIHADPAKFLDWDKGIGAQHPEVRSALANAYGTSRTMMADSVWQGKDGRWYTAQGDTLVGRADGWPDESTAKQVLRVMQDQGLPNMTGGEWLRHLGSPAVQSEKLRDAGIPGVKYLDGGSRAAGDGSRNYVVFDDKIIEILRKYGLLPMAGAGAFAAMPGNNQDNSR